MRAPAFLAIAAATSMSHGALADVIRHEYVPKALLGSWAPSQDVCNKKDDKTVVVLSPKGYVGAGSNCTVAWVSETPGAKGAIFSAHLLCDKPGDKAQRTQSNLIMLPLGGDKVSLGSDFNNLKDYQRCPAE